MSAFDRYCRLQDQLRSVRQAGYDQNEIEEHILQQMVSVWWELSQDERDLVDYDAQKVKQ
jgi:hypothetical protein